MNDTPGLASSQHFTITNDEPVQGAGLPTGSLQEAWNDILNRIRTTYAADLESASEYGLAWLGALLQAKVIDLATFEALHEARVKAKDEAQERFARTDSGL